MRHEHTFDYSGGSCPRCMEGRDQCHGCGEIAPCQCERDRAAGIAVLATIELDRPDKARGELFYRDGDIWCRVVGSGEAFATQTGATEETAAQVIADAWRLPCWDLQWVENGGAA